MEGLTYYPGSFGEIVQGRIDERDILMSCPVNLFTCVRIFESKSPVNRIKYKKSNEFLNNILKRWGFENYSCNFDIEISSDIPKGKGFASSTADLCGIYHSLLKIFKKEFSQTELVEECIRIEPTDSIVFDGLTIFDYKNGHYAEKLGNYIEFYILGFEGSRIVDTVRFNNSNLPPLKDLSFLSNIIKKGIKEADLRLIADSSTESIIGNLHRVEYTIIDQILDIGKKTGGLGIIGAHSGDAIGIIYEDFRDLKKGIKYADMIKGYRCYVLKTLRSIDYENYYVNSAK